METDQNRLENDKPTLENIPKPAKGKQGQEITYYQEDGQEMRKYVQSGVIQRYSTKANKWVFAPGTAKLTITQENASQLATQRWDKYEAAAMQGIMEATGSQLDTDAVRKLTHAATTHALQGNKGGPQYLQHAREMAGLVRDKQRSHDIEPGTVRLTATMSIDQLRKTLSDQYQAHDTERPELIDVTPTVIDSPDDGTSG